MHRGGEALYVDQLPGFGQVLANDSMNAPSAKSSPDQAGVPSTAWPAIGS